MDDAPPRRAPRRRPAGHDRRDASGVLVAVARGTLARVQLEAAEAAS